MFIACNMSNASPARTSPTIILSGLMRNAFRTRSRIVIAPVPSKFAGRDSNVTTCCCCNRNSAASSIVTILSVEGMNEDNTFNVVVLPEPVPPDTKMFNRARTHASKNCPISALNVPKLIRSFIDRAFFENFRIVTTGPTNDNGGIMIFTREPSAKRASTNGLDSSTRRPNGVKIRSIILIKCALS